LVKTLIALDEFTLEVGDLPEIMPLLSNAVAGILLNDQKIQLGESICISAN